MRRSCESRKYLPGFGLLPSVLGTFLLLTTEPARASETVLVVRPSGQKYEEAFIGIKEGIGDELVLKELVVGDQMEEYDISVELSRSAPKLLVLMNIQAIRLMARYQAKLPDPTKSLPSVSLMAELISRAVDGLHNAAAITYEMPIVTAVVNLRLVSQSAIKKVGVVHRERMNDFIAENRKFCEKEGIEIVSHALPDSGANIRFALTKCLPDLIRNTDVLWVPNDMALLRADLIRDIWVPEVRKFSRPVIVGNEVLVNPKLRFGTFAVMPDHRALGAQAAELVLEIMDNGWVVGKQRNYPPVSTFKVINQEQAARMFQSDAKDMKSVDKKLK